MEDILYAIKEHAIGLNCGIWDYSASIIQKFGMQSEQMFYLCYNVAIQDKKMQPVLICLCRKSKRIFNSGPKQVCKCWSNFSQKLHATSNTDMSQT